MDYNPNEQNSAIEMLLFSDRSLAAGDVAFSGIYLLSESIFTHQLTLALIGKFDVDSDDVVSKSAIMEFLVHVMNEPAFDQLRTKEQLGTFCYK